MRATFVPLISHTVHCNNLDSGGNPSSLSHAHLSHGIERDWKSSRGKSRGETKDRLGPRVDEGK